MVQQFWDGPKANGKVRLCLDLVQLNEARIRPIYWGLMLNDILLRLTGVKYLMLIDASSRYHNLKFNEKSSYVITFSFPFGRYQYIRLLIWNRTGKLYAPKTEMNCSMTYLMFLALMMIF